MEFTEHVKIREEKFGSVIFDTLREKVFVTNDTGGDILRLIKEGQSLEKIIDILANSYSTQPKDIRDDTISFINQLKDNNIIEHRAKSIEQRA
jgi:hypothetical protein